jgi:hypothetical protein
MFSFRFIESTIIVLVMKQARQINIRILASISRLKNNVTWNSMPHTPHGNRHDGRYVAHVIPTLLHNQVMIKLTSECLIFQAWRTMCKIKMQNAR